MPYQKLKRERYESFGGLNTKISPYLNSQLEFLSLENVDFQIPGSLKKRWGSTQFFGQSFPSSVKVDGLYEFTQTGGSSFFYASAGGTLGLVFDNGFSAIFSGSSGGMSYFLSYGSSNIDRFSLGASLNEDFDTLQNQAFLANQKAFLKTTNGLSFYFYGLPTPILFAYGASATLVVGSTGNANGFTGTYIYKVAWINSYGMQGPPTQLLRGASAFGFNILGIPTFGATQISLEFSGGTGGPDLATGSYIIPTTGMVPPNFDITGLALFRTQGLGYTTLFTSPYIEELFVQQATPYGTTAGYLSANNLDYFLVQVQGVSQGSVLVRFTDVPTSGGITLLNSNVIPWNWYAYAGLIRAVSGATIPGITFPYGLTLPVGFGVTMVPQFVETYANRLWISGTSYSPSTLFFSEFNEPEHLEADFNFDVRTTDGEPVSALKAYSGNLFVFKPGSFHILSGDDPSNFSLTQVSAEYGCLSNRAVAQYSNYLVFLDQKGVIRYNGANIDILSTKIDPIFRRMNVNACKDNASIVYDKQRNQILVDIPVDGSTKNNLTCVYDIIQGSWTTYTGYQPAITAVAKSSLNTDHVFFGGYSGLMSYFGPSFLTDNGVGFTCRVKSGFISDLGESVSKNFRRLFMDVEPAGASSAVDINLYQDYGASIVISRTMYQSPFQSRLEYGISGKALSAEFIMGSTYAFTLHGFTIEYRFLRNL